MFRSMSSIVLGISILIVQGCSVVSSSYKASRDVTARTQHVADSAIEVKSRNGGVEVIGDADLTEVVVEATLTCAGSTQAEADDRIAAATLLIDRRDDETLFIRPSFPVEARSNDGCSIKIRVPDGRNVTIKTSNGPGTSGGLSGLLIIDTSNGPVSVRDHDGELRLDTSNGPIVATKISGAVAADTSNGAITLMDVGGPVTADTSNGNVMVTLADGHAGPLVIDTSNSNVTVTVKQTFTGKVLFDTSNGRTSIVDTKSRVTDAEFDEKHRDGFVVVGADDSRSEIDTSNGSITFVIQ